MACVSAMPVLGCSNCFGFKYSSNPRTVTPLALLFFFMNVLSICANNQSKNGLEMVTVHCELEETQSPERWASGPGYGDCLDGIN